MKSLQLSEPVAHDGKTITRINFRPLTFSDIISGPESPVSKGGALDWQAACEWALILSDAPPEVIDNLPAKDARRVIDLIAWEFARADPETVKRMAGELVFGANAASIAEIQQMTVDELAFWYRLAIGRQEEQRRNDNANK